MTTIVPKGTNRPAAQARSSRHAQHTMLPPRPGQVEQAREAPVDKIVFHGIELEGDLVKYAWMSEKELRVVVAELGIEPAPRRKIAILRAILKSRTDSLASPELLLKYGSMEVRELRSFARRFGIDPLPRGKGPLLDAIREAEQSGKTLAPLPSAKKPKTPALSNSRTKADRFLTDAVAAGWKSEITSDESGRVEVTSTRGSEILVTVWKSGQFDYDEGRYLVADRAVKPRNASAARKLLVREAETAEKELKRVVTNRAFRPKIEAPRAKALPFDPKTAIEPEIVSALVGRTVTWYNRISAKTQSANVGPDPRRVRISEHSGDRVVTFCDPATGFNSFRLSALVQVGRSTRSSSSTPRRARQPKHPKTTEAVSEAA